LQGFLAVGSISKGFEVVSLPRIAVKQYWYR
jgi:hypothetical protein